MIYSGLSFQLGLLMESFDRRHFTAALWDLDAVTDEDKAPIDAQAVREQAQHHLGP